MIRYEDDEGPSDADLRRFGENGQAWCPECGEEVFDDADLCTACGAWITGSALRRPRAVQELHHRSRIVVIVLVLIAFLSGLLWAIRIVF